MKKVINYALAATALCFLSACGGGGGSGANTEIPNTGPVIFTVNKNGADFSDSYSYSTNFTQNLTSAYFVSSNAVLEWSGSNMGYTSGYITPTSGILKAFMVTKRYPNELAYSITNVNYDISKSSASLYSDLMPFEALAEALETKVYGGVNNDITNFFYNTIEVDLGAGSDTLRLTQNINAYQFSRVMGSNTSLNITRDDKTTLVKNDEIIQFADVSKTISEVLALAT